MTSLDPSLNFFWTCWWPQYVDLCRLPRMQFWSGCWFLALVLVSWKLSAASLFEDINCCERNSLFTSFYQVPPPPPPHPHTHLFLLYFWMARLMVSVLGTIDLKTKWCSNTISIYGLLSPPNSMAWYRASLLWSAPTKGLHVFLFYAHQFNRHEWSYVANMLYHDISPTLSLA